MTAAADANEYSYNLGYDFTLADAYDLDYLDADGEAKEDERAARQALNVKMAEWYGLA